jgi:hypothetical protein
VTGRYFVNSKPKRSSERSYDEATAARLWRVSADLVGFIAAGRTIQRGAASAAGLPVVTQE